MNFSVKMAFIFPRSYLFPYTTLFRSIRIVRDEQGLLQVFVESVDGFDVPMVTLSGAEGSALHFTITYPEFADRKSTRLNSSHLVISYAVFCLKKKNYKNNILNK